MDQAMLFNRSWFGVRSSQKDSDVGMRFAFLTNVRGVAASGTHSRGLLIPFALSDTIADEARDALLVNVSGVNLFTGCARLNSVGNLSVVVSHATNVGARVLKHDLAAGIHVVSNAPFGDSSWPKVKHLEKRMQAQVSSDIHAYAAGALPMSDLLDNAASLLCECPNFPKNTMPQDIVRRDREVQLQKGVYTPSAARRSRSAGAFIREKHRRKTHAVDDNQLDSHRALQHNRCFQTTMQTIFCIYASHGPGGTEGDPYRSYRCTVRIRETFTPDVHGPWKEWDFPLFPKSNV